MIRELANKSIISNPLAAALYDLIGVLRKKVRQKPNLLEYTQVIKAC